MTGEPDYEDWVGDAYDGFWVKVYEEPDGTWSCTVVIDIAPNRLARDTARRGEAWQGKAWHGKAWHGKARIHRAAARTPSPLNQKGKIYMNFIYVDVEIVGTNSMLQHRFGETAQAASGGKTRRNKVDSRTPREIAEESLYKTPKGQLFHPGSSISNLLKQSGTNHVQPGKRKSLKWIVPAAIRVMDDALLLRRPNGTLKKTWDVDSRPVVIPSTKGRVMRHRPVHYEWMLRFKLRVDLDLMEESVAHMLLTEGGELLGIGDYRPEKGGSFGTFRVTKWQPGNTDKKKK